MKNKSINTIDRMVEIIKKCGCPCVACKEIIQKINMELINKIIDLENRLQKHVIITSGRRCIPYNSSIGGYVDSPHITGLAADIRVEGIPILELAKICVDIGFKRVGIYPNHVHVDMIDPIPSLFWYVRKYNEAPIYSGRFKTLEEFLKYVKK